MPIQPDFPFVSGDSTGYFKYAEEDSTVRGRIIQLLNTSPGERCNLCDYGVSLKDFLFEPLDDISIQKLKDTIYQQMQRYEPSLSIRNLQIMITDLAQATTLYLRLEVVNIKKRTRSNLIFTYPIGS
jgi:hypothetical protein